MMEGRGTEGGGGGGRGGGGVGALELQAELEEFRGAGSRNIQPS